MEKVLNRSIFILLFATHLWHKTFELHRETQVFALDISKVFDKAGNRVF